MALVIDRLKSAEQEVDDPRATAEQSAYHEAMRLSVPEIARRLQENLGQRLTALLVGVSDAKAVGRWARGERAPHPVTERRLRAAYHVAAMLLAADAPETVRAWFGGMNPTLSDRAPALVLPEEPHEVLAAAREFLANG